MTKATKTPKTPRTPRLPKRVRVLGKIFKVIYIHDLKDEDGSKLFGDTDGDTATIRIDSAEPIHKQRLTLVHEIMHAAFFVAGLSDLLGEDNEEAAVRCLESALAPAVDINHFLIRRNHG